jgi:hypothetical protein
MAKYPNSGALSPNEYKKSQSQPDFKGKINMEISLLRQLVSESEDGQTVDIRISGWNRSGARGDFVSLAYDSYKPNKDKPAARPAMPAPRPKPQQQFDDDDDIPF